MTWPRCNTTIEDERLVEPPVLHGFTIHQILYITGAVGTAIATVLSLFQIIRHATRFSNKDQQRQIIRILFMIPVYAITNFLAIVYYWHAVYFNLLGNAYAALGLASFFSLLCTYISGSETHSLHDLKNYCRYLLPSRWKWPVTWLQKCIGGEHGMFRTPRSGLTWFNINFIGVFQYVFILVALSVVGVITQAYDRYCVASLSPAFAHIWVLSFNTISAVISSYCLTQFHSQLRQDLKQHRTSFQFFCINIVLYLSTYQNLILAVILAFGLIKSSDKVQTPELKVTIPSCLMCVELGLVAILHLRAYPSSTYINTTFHISTNDGNTTEQTPEPSYHGGFLGWRAICSALNIWDIVKAIARSAKWLWSGRRYRESDISYVPNSRSHIPNPYGFAPGPTDESNRMLNSLFPKEPVVLEHDEQDLSQMPAYGRSYHSANHEWGSPGTQERHLLKATKSYLKAGNISHF